MVYRGTYSKGIVVFDGDVKLAEGQAVRVEVEDEPARVDRPSVWQDLLELAGSCPDLPRDLAENHDHYLYGVAKRDKQA